MENEKLQEQTESMADYEAHFDDANPWNVVARYQEEGTNLHVKVEGIVNGGVIAMVEGLRGFIPASRLSLSYIEDLETYLLKEIDVRVIEANQAEGRLILSAREILREQKKAEDAKKLASVQVGSVVKGTVESLQCFCTSRERSFRSGSHFPDQYPENQISRPGTSRWGRSRCQSHRYQRR